MSASGPEANIALFIIVRFEKPARFEFSRAEMEDELTELLDEGEVRSVEATTIDKEKFESDADPADEATRVEVGTNKLILEIDEIRAVEHGVQSLAKGFIKPRIHSTLVQPSRDVLKDPTEI